MSVPGLVMNCLAPLITHSPSSSFAVVRTLPASEPASGSVKPKEASRSPLHSFGSHSVFCSSEPQLAELGDDLVGEGMVAVELVGHRRDLGPGEVPDRVAQHSLLVTEFEVHAYSFAFTAAGS